MKHLDDGQIAELIDGPAGGRSGGPVLSHVAECAACRERIEEARLTAERARAILGAAVPAARTGVVAPPFEEILHRAGQARRTGQRRGSLRWLGWAATVVLAGGLGWFARGELIVSDAPPAVAEQMVGRVDGQAGAADSFARESLSDELRRLNAAQEPPLATAPAGARERPPAQEQRQFAASPPAEGVVVTTEERGRREADAARDRAGAESKAAGAAAPPPAAPAPLPLARSDDAARPQLRQAEPENERVANLVVPPARRTDVLDRRVVITSKETAEQVVGGPVATVEGVPIQEYYLVEGQQMVQTVQRLSDGHLLELDQWRANLPSTATAPAPSVPGFTRERRQLAALDSAVASETLVVDGLRIVARAPIPADSLRALLRRLRR